MKVFVVYYLHEHRFDGLYGCYKSEKVAMDAVAELEEAGFRAIIQMFHMKQ